ncbi:BURP domain-containing protein BNM2A-like [Hibiscus syriacus]|uniref:BURP domain-containing protein BNM2A-like n=1 Tax=Hibiscus syriacus TaxID=106335 RepID=UPI0019248333|nr:BURP domain-containing protein BNM2A-like [Hibiscus syriacus]
MGNEFVYCSFLVLLLVWLAPGNVAASHMEEDDVRVLRLPEGKEDGHSSSHMRMGMAMGMEEEDLLNPAAKVFATIKDVEVGKTMPIYFPYIDDPSSYQFLPKQKTHHIPLSSEQLPELLRFFPFSPDSNQALAMKQTLKICEMEAPKGEVQGCVTSLESMVDFAESIFGPDSKVGVVRSSLISKSTPLLQNYTVVESKEISTGKLIACHNEPYPYAVYYCHFQWGTVNKVFMVSLVGENGDEVNAVFLCHMDTSSWSAGHIGFRLLRLKPGESEICHFFPAYDMVVVP